MKTTDVMTDVTMTPCLPCTARDGAAAGAAVFQSGTDRARAVPTLAMAGGLRMADRHDEDGGGHVVVDTKPRTKRPPLYKVLLLNDDYTPMEFVVLVLERFFGMTHAQAFEIMLTVHKKGVAVVGVFSHEIAETKVAQVMDFARKHQHPLQCTMEKE